MKVLFISHQSRKDNSAYTHRLLKLKNGFENKGIDTKIIYLADYTFKKPTLIQPLNSYFVKKEFDNFDFVHSGHVQSTFSSVFLKNKKIN